MSLGDKIEVEPLSDARWSKIERSLFEKLDREEGREASAPPIVEAPAPRTRWRAVRWTLFAAAAIVALVVGFRLTWRAPDIAANPSRIVTGASESHLALGESSLDVGPESTLVVSGDDDRGVLIVLDRGKVACEVAPRKGRPPFVVQAGGVRVRVIGTRFTVIRDGESARVEVAHGVVEVSASGSTTILHDGESWPAATPAPTTTSASTAPTTTATATATIAAAPPAVVSADDPIVVRVPPKKAAPSAPPPVTAFPSEPPPPAPPPDVAPTPKQLFEEASKLEARDPSRAIAIYRQLASGGGAWAMNALFAWGRLEADRGNRGEARRLLNEYLARFPRGPNAADARALLERIK